MSQRNPQNARYTTERKGTSRRSSSSAKPKSKAGSSVYTGSSSSAAKTKEQRKAEKAKQREAERELEDRRAIAKANESLDDYSKWRRVWIVMIVLAILAIAVSWGGPYLMNDGMPLAALSGVKNIITVVALVIGYIAIIAALVVDFKFIRPIRKGQAAMQRRESKKERQHRETAEAEAEAKKSKRGKK